MNDGRTSTSICAETEPNQRRVRSGPCVYFIRAGDAIKIGFSEDVKRRFAGIQTGHSEELTLLGTVPDGGNAERYYHERFAHLHLRGEWYRAEPELISAIRADCAVPRDPSTLSYKERAEAFDNQTKHYLTSQRSAMIFARTNVLFRYRQLLENPKLPPDIRDWHLKIHEKGLVEALSLFERAKTADVGAAA